MDSVSMMVPVDFANISTVLAQDNAMDRISTAVLSQSINTAKEDGAALVKMMERSVNPAVGGNFDVSI